MEICRWNKSIYLQLAQLLMSRLSYTCCLLLYAVLRKDKRYFVSASERINGARATNIEQLSEQRDAAGPRRREKEGEGKRINKEGHDVVRDMINVADRERNRTSRSGTKAAFGLTLQGSVVPLPRGRGRRNPSIGRHPVSFSILFVRSVSCAYLDTYLTALISFFDKDTPSSLERHESQIDWIFIRISLFSNGTRKWYLLK